MKDKIKIKTIGNLSRLSRSRPVGLFKLLVLPHEGNGYHPHIIRHYGIVAIIALIIGLQFGCNLVSGSSVLGDVSRVTISGLLEETNIARSKESLNSLILNDKLNQAASLKAQDMIHNQYWGHTSPTGVEPWKWLGDVDYRYDIAGENLAKNFETSNATVAAWMASPSHRENVMNESYKDVGFAIVSGEIGGQPVSLVVAFYGRQASEVAGQQVQTFIPGFGQIDLLSRLEIAFRSLPVAAIVSILILAIASVSAGLAYSHRHKLPAHAHKTLRKHHGLYEMTGFIALIVAMLVIHSGGQI